MQSKVYFKFNWEFIYQSLVNTYFLGSDIQITKALAFANVLGIDIDAFDPVDKRRLYQVLEHGWRFGYLHQLP